MPVMLPLVLLAGCTKGHRESSMNSDKGRSEGVIYSRDSRAESSYVQNLSVQRLSQLSVALIGPSSLKALDSTMSEVIGDSLQEAKNLCSSEKFIEQRTAAFCSGILIDSRRVLTAGHCVFTAQECENTKIVLGYDYRLGNAMNYKIPQKNIFNCRRVISAEKMEGLPTEAQQGFDFSIIELDRDAPLPFKATLNIEDNLQRGDALFTLGYPLGLPKKYADGKVTQNRPGGLYFYADIDAYGGNSGSPVFNARTGALEGILISGEEDISPTKEGCQATHHCDGNGCLGEMVLKMSMIRKHLLPH